MDNIKNIVITAVVVGGLAIGLVSVAKTSNISLNSSPNVSTPSGEGQRFGSLTGPIIYSDYLVVGGVKTSYRWAEFTATSSSICKLQAPTNATSTVTSIAVKVNTILIPSVPVLDVSTSSATSGGYGSSTPAFIASATPATTTPLYWVAPGNASTTVKLWGITPNSLGNGSVDFVVAPSEWITVKLATTTPGTFAAGYLTGVCSAVFREF